MRAESIEIPSKVARSRLLARPGARFVLAALTVLIAGCGNQDRPPGPATRPRNLLLITVDTLRADALGANGNSSAVTPWLDRLSRGGARFDRARAHSVLTLPSHANIMTGRLPPDHGVRDNAGFRLAATEETLATRLKARGFSTGAFVSAFPLDSRFGLARSFDVYDDEFIDAAPQPAFLEQERSAVATVDAAKRWLATQKPGWFCWVHLYEPHFPYAPPAPFADRFARAPYAGEVAATDAALAPLLQPILDAGAANDTLVVFTADHGESLGEHGEATHGIFAYEATLRVPLVLYYPSLITPGTNAADVGHVDLVPTILELFGMPPASGLRGQSLVDLTRGKAQTDGTLYFEALSGSLNRGWAPLTGVIAGGLKYIDLPIPELYDVAADPGEARNLAATRQETVEHRRTLLRSFAGGAITRRAESADVRDRLRALGYTDSGGSAAGRTRYTPADDPKQLVGVDSELQEIVGLYLSGDTRSALLRCRSLVSKHPGMRVARLQLAHLERDAGNLPQAVAVLRRAVSNDPGDVEAASLLGAYLTAANQPLDAIALLQPFAAHSAPDVQILVSLALAQARARRFDDARAALQRALADDPANARLLVTIGTVELMAGHRTAARGAFEAALAKNPDTARAHSSLAAMAAEDGQLNDALARWRRATALDADEFEKLLAVAISLAKSGREADARLHFQLFAETAPPARYAADIDRARAWLSRERR